MNKNIIKIVFTLVGAIAFASCSAQSEYNEELQNEYYILENTENENTKNAVIPQIIEQENIIANNNNNKNISDLEKLTHQQINQYRASKNLRPLKLDESISQQARIHSQNMAQGKAPFSHQGFEKRVDAVSSKISYRSAAENLAYNQGYSDPVANAVKGWINSPGHHKNMIGNFNLTGIGVAKNSQGEYYFTQIFILENN